MSQLPLAESPNDSPRVFFPNLDGLRFLAFFSVFLAHSFYTRVDAIKASWLHQTVVHYAHLGIFGVNFFFVLSGFLITYLLLVEESVRGTIRVGAFYVRRVLRIWPLYFVVATIGFTLWPFARACMGKPYQETANIWYYVFFLSNFDDEPASSILGVLWSIAIEEQFYLIWPILIKFLPGRAIIFPSIVLGSWVFRYFNVDHERTMYMHTFSCISDMAVGGWAAYAYLRSTRFRSWLRDLGKIQVALTYVIGFGLIATREFWHIGPLALASERLIFSLIFAFVILEQNFCENSPLKCSRLPYIGVLGTYTYGLYLLHCLAIQIVNNVFRMLTLNGNLVDVLVTETAACLAFSILLAGLSYHVFEKHFLRLKARWASAPDQPSP